MATPVDVLSGLMAKRRSVRRFVGTPIAVEDLQRLGDCAAGKGVVPSAHALYPLRIDVVAYSVVGMERGQFLPDGHGGLTCVGAPPAESALLDACLDKPAWVNAAAVLAISAVESPIAHFADQAGDPRRGYRFIHMEAGHAAQNIQLMVAALGLGTVLIGGIDDSAASAALRLPEKVMPIGFLPVGVPA